MKTLTYRLFASFLVVLFFLLPLQAAAAQEAQPGGGQPAAPLVPETTLGAIYNTNLIPDGNAEVPYANYWVDHEGFTQIVAYGASCGASCGFPSPYDPGPVLRDQNFFYLGQTTNHINGNNMWIKDRISLAPIQSAVDSGKIRYIISGYFGGWSSQTDTSQLHMFFEVTGKPNTGEVNVGNVTAADRQNKTVLLYRAQTGYIPKGTQYINLVLQSGNLSGSKYRTGFADNLSLILLPVQEFVPSILNGKPPTLPPKTGYPAPTNLIADPDGLTRMDIYWTDNTKDELGFEVQRINADSSVDTICNTKPNVTFCQDPGIRHGSSSGYAYLGSQVTYTYQVRAVGPGINSAWANGTGTTAQMPLTPPSPTRGAFTCQAIDVSSTSATFVWNDPFNYEAGFNLYLDGSTTASWTMLEGGTKISFINLTGPESKTLTIVPFVFDSTNPVYVYESSTSCSATANLPSPPGSGVTRFSNNASYPVISLVVDGWEQFPVGPLGIQDGSYYELTGVPAGQHTWTAVTGFWDDWGNRHAMYTYTGSYSQPSIGSLYVSIPDMTIQNLLSVPPANLGYWEGYYFDAYGSCWTAAFKFKQDGTYTLFNANKQIDSGTYSLVQREPVIFSVKFHVSGSQSKDGLLIETHGQFFMQNGPTSWPKITYVYKPQGYIRNPFCP